MKTLKQLVEATPQYHANEYYPTLRSTFNALEKAMKERGGYEIDPNEMIQFGVDGVSYGQNKKTIFTLLKNGQVQRKRVNVQIYRMDSGNYELNYYLI